MKKFLLSALLKGNFLYFFPETALKFLGSTVRMKSRRQIAPVTFEFGQTNLSDLSASLSATFNVYKIDFFSLKQSSMINSYCQRRNPTYIIRNT